MRTAAAAAYEVVVESLLKTKLQEAGLAELQSFHLKSYAGKSGQWHAVDVSFEVRLGELQLLFVVECKQHRRRVGVEDVMTFAYRMRDIGAHKGLIVATNGFQRGAATVAKAERIALLTVARGRLVSSWDGMIAQHFAFWIAGLSLRVAEDGHGITLVGHRHVACNAVWEPVPVQACQGDDSDGGPVYFLLPEEQTMISNPARATQARQGLPPARGPAVQMWDLPTEVEVV